MHVLILLALPDAIREQYRARLQAAFPDVTVTAVEHHTKVGPYIADADALITFGAHMSDQVLEDGVKLRWIQALGTGVDGIADRPALRPGTIVTSLHGLHGAAVSEAALASMLALARDLRRSIVNQVAARWERFPVTLLRGKTVCILGVGIIAEELAPKCAALGMTVVGISSAPRVLPGFTDLRPHQALEETVSEADYLVVLAPYTEATRGIVDGRILAAMKPTSFVVNVARGGVIDEAALVDALDRKAIAGAALDVFSEEPLPADHPLWRFDTVLVTPHTAGFHVGYADDALPIVEENLRRFIAGDEADLINIVPTPGGETP
ncbi:MAG: D-2-hydroxyacid dehydrogenase [Candidatus Dormibacteraeota bacterium]|nr:D-2-hydroxyacid dehydrogenase [Candidatus Dormibacteraeota bacterium]